MTRDQKIAEIAIDLICNSSMKPEQWKATSLGAMHPRPAIPLALEEGECVIVSASFVGGDWYAWTTRRLVSVCEGIDYEAPSTSIGRAEFGIFKGPPTLLNAHTAALHTLVATLYSNTRIAVRMRYETGYASMAPIHCHKYWMLKHPILDKLLSPAEIAAYRQSKTSENGRI